MPLPPPTDDHGLNLPELRRYLQRVGDRWPIARALVGGARVDDAHGALPQRERGPEWIVVLISDGFDGIPWLERVYQASSLWDGSEMRSSADMHCYTPAEFERKRDSLPRVRQTEERGLELVPAGAR